MACVARSGSTSQTSSVSCCKSVFARTSPSGATTIEAQFWKGQAALQLANHTVFSAARAARRRAELHCAGEQLRPLQLLRIGIAQRLVAAGDHADVAAAGLREDSDAEPFYGRVVEAMAGVESGRE